MPQEEGCEICIHRRASNSPSESKHAFRSASTAAATPHSTASASMQVHEVILEKKKKNLKLSFLVNVICQTPPSQALAQPLEGSRPVWPPQGEERLHRAGSQICLQRKSHWAVLSGTTKRIHCCDPGLPCDLRPRTISLYLVAPGELQIQFRTSCGREKRTHSHPERHNQ